MPKILCCANFQHLSDFDMDRIISIIPSISVPATYSTSLNCKIWKLNLNCFLILQTYHLWNMYRRS
ncbi:hypothetical protein BDFB_012771 [Asbolus verrucosus]|uniref:Uncharacterized protein n=1 Tax=Asbolus verrucosus TaxID=1661398 RepID=A0A482W668_ASBVE|nr:hypothetical protein BDFB_012771 [Asbolus verrucosus]